MAVKNRKPKKHVIGKYPLGGAIGGLTPELMDLLRTYVQDNTPGNNQGVPTDTTPITDSLPIDNLGQSLTPDLMGGIDTPSIEKKPSINIGDALSKGIEANSGLMSLMGGIQTGLANKPGYAPDVSQGISGGALSGLSTGFSMGGPMGGLIGLLGGGALGFMNSGQKREDYETALERSRKQRVKDRTVDPFMGVLYAEEGGITPGDVPAEELTPVQTEEGEMMLMPSGILTATKAKDKHDDMDEDDITDILPAGTIIFSNSLDNMLPINEELEDTILGYGTAFYSEEGDNTDVKAVQFEEVLDDKKKKMTFAEIANNIKNKFSTVKDHKDVFNNITNVENMQARIPFLMKLTGLQDKVMGNSSIPTTATAQSFSKGGVVKKYPLGGQIGGLNPQLLDMIKKYFTPYVDSSDGNPPPPPPPTPPSILPPPPGGDPVYEPAITIDDLLQKHNDFLDSTKANLEKENADRAAGDLALEKDLRRNNVMANAVIGPLGYLMQNPQVKPAYTDTNLSGAMFRPGSNQAAQGVANTGMGQVNSLTQELIRQGINPVDAISMTASARGKATEQANDINLKQLQKNEELDRAKYKFLSEARTSNEAADVKAYNDTNDQQNKIIAGIAGEGKTFIKDDSSIDSASNQWRTQRAKDYYESITNLDKSGIDLGTKLYEIDAAKKQAFDQEQMIAKFLEGMKKVANNGNTGGGTDGSTGGDNEPKHENGTLIRPPVSSDTPTPVPPQPSGITPEPLEGSLPSPDDASTMTPQQIGELQKTLNRDRASRNLPPIAEDSDWGPETRKALIEAEGAKNGRRLGEQMPEGLIVPTPISGDLPTTPTTPTETTAPKDETTPVNGSSNSTQSNTGKPKDENGVEYTPTKDGGREYELVSEKDKDGNYEKTKEIYDKDGKLVSSRVDKVNSNNPNSKESYEETKFDKNGGTTEVKSVTTSADGSYDDTTTIVYGKDKDGISTGKPISKETISEYRPPEGGEPLKERAIISYNDNGKFKESRKYIIGKDNKETISYHQFYAQDQSGESVLIDINMKLPDYKKATLTINPGTPGAKLISFNSYEEAMSYVDKTYKK